MIFASKTPRDLYGVPATALIVHEDGTTETRDLPGVGITMSEDGEFMFVQVQAHEPNPILTAFREQRRDWDENAGMGASDPDTWLDALTIYADHESTPRPDEGWADRDPFDLVNVWPAHNSATATHVDHARRVFGHLMCRTAGTSE